VRHPLLESIAVGEGLERLLRRAERASSGKPRGGLAETKICWPKINGFWIG